MNQFSAFSSGDVRGIACSPSIDEVKALGAVAVQRECENAGTFLIDENEYPVAFVPNCESLGGTWMYYSDAVARHYGLRYFADAS